MPPIIVILFGLGFAVFVAAMTYAFLRADSRPADYNPTDYDVDA